MTVYAPGTASEQQDALVVNVKDHGAKGDGATDDTAAIQAAERLLTSGGVLYFPPGTYMISNNTVPFNQGLLFTRSNVIWRGAGADATVLRKLAGSAVTAIMQSDGSGTYTASNVTVEEMTLDWNRPAFSSFNVNTITVADFGLAGSLVVRRCRFFQPPTGGVQVNGALDTVRIEDNLFEGPGTAVGQAIGVNASARRVLVRRNIWRYLQAGIIVSAAAGQLVRWLEVTGNTGDLGWYSLVPSGVIGDTNATYTATTVADSGAPFAGVTTAQDVRVMATVTGPTVPTSYGNAGVITDNSKNFNTLGVTRGMLVRTSGGSFGIVQAVPSATKVQVEQWLSDTNRLPVLAPAGTESYTIFSTVMGKVTAVAAGTLTVNSWRDFNGNAVTPVAGTHYEVLPSRPGYMCQIAVQVQYGKIADNIFRRGWNDQIAIQASKMEVIGNLVEDGQDNGIVVGVVGTTITHVRVNHNIVHHQGTNGITFGGGSAANPASDCQATDNVLIDNVSFNLATQATTADLKLDMCSRVTCDNNVLDHETSQGTVGLSVGANSIDALVTNLRSRNHTTGVTVTAGASGTKLFNSVVENITDAGTGSIFRGNPGFNPRGAAVTQPAVPASGTPLTNTTGVDCTVFITGGTLSGIAIGGTATGLGVSNDAVRLPAGQTITLTYTVAPTWTWFGD